jgi:glycosyltransferase involved in cell wall biosynthesis
LSTRTKKNIYILTENAITGNIQENVRHDNMENKTLNLIIIGELSARKNIKLLLDALLQIKDRNKIHLRIVGSGKEEKYLKKYVITNDLKDIVEFCGKVNRDKVFSFLALSDLHILTSIKESATTVLFEAMSMGVPTLSLNHVGMKDVLCEKCGILIDITSYAETKKEIARNIDKCLQNRNILNRLKNNVISCRKKWYWVPRISIYDKYFWAAIKDYHEMNGVFQI